MMYILPRSISASSNVVFTFVKLRSVNIPVAFVVGIRGRCEKSFGGALENFPCDTHSYHFNTPFEISIVDFPFYSPSPNENRTHILSRFTSGINMMYILPRSISASSNVVFTFVKLKSVNIPAAFVVGIRGFAGALENVPRDSKNDRFSRVFRRPKILASPSQGH
ncbi:hypothetical protein CDAR_105891 [Caerostris darwini]|uniref:Uncharacterized protein n=1 Tax=Caerostris darwini TaxID=1538125 RepID=A0AAV4TT69_9ARAC|nr:hypothetical protein CDAR_105891 [Caerostris darwini]